MSITRERPPVWTFANPFVGQIQINSIAAQRPNYIVLRAGPKSQSATGYWVPARAREALKPILSTRWDLMARR